MGQVIKIGNRSIGQGYPAFIIAEIGINHNGDIDLAQKLIDVALIAGCDAVKLQKRDPVEATPEEYKNVMRETPWGLMTYLEYKKRLEFGREEYDQIDSYCRDKGILWTASPWDISSIDFLERYDLAFYKVPSALITNKEYLERIKKSGRPLIVSTGMANMELVEKVIEFLGEDNIILLHAVSTYPARPQDINLNVIRRYKQLFNCPVGYSGHEVGLQITIAAAALEAKVIERHVTLDRSMWGTDQAASVEATGLIRLVRDIRLVESAIGSADKTMITGELEVERKLRKVHSL